MTPPNHCHSAAHRTPETGHWATRPLHKEDFGGENSFLRTSKTDTWGPRKEMHDQRGSGWLESRMVERGELGMHSKTETNSEV